ncbi:nucleotidyltransferase family protein [Paraglaciecola sp. 20A4]|uniref:nucleotidyltransferase family protein n=1 Tax=Paraglaciecola sp. 20A4 TaxID=2687288 RepID=UPI00140885AA|nr:nucleotidyltransferase family protein [Paraglaciecola sp. 20A4]
MKVAALMLAAGQSKRFNGIKQLAEINGQPMLLHTLNHLTSSGELLDKLWEFNIILGAHAPQIKHVLPSYVTPLQFIDWQKGMGASLAFGVKNVHSESSHLLVTLADQVAIRREHVETMLHHCAQAPGKIIAARYDKVLGAPVIFPRCYFTQLLALDADTGARKILQLHIDDVVAVDISNAQYDIDTQLELAAWRHSAN